MSMMSTNRLILLLFFLFVIEGSVMPWIIPVDYAGKIIPHFSFVFVLYAALYSGRHRALMFGIGIGLIQDIVYYGHLLGVHTFMMGLIGYFAGLLFDRRRSTLLTCLSVIGFACIAYDSAVYFIYSLFRLTEESYAFALLDHILPSLFLQLAFALVIYVPVRKLYEQDAKLNQDQDEE
ncbi:rod shape-determining protein MreD [Paenibacillus sp. FSL H8-0537]|uniref:rod shape-determining protein MreD n=1 Tax=Paenibacillus sp. FSL H8-0537 TaxID=2921399 RepID=UPI003101AE4B